MITLEQAFGNIDSVVANVALTRKEHMILVESMQVIKKATMPLKEVMPELKPGPKLVEKDGCEDHNSCVGCQDKNCSAYVEPEGDEEDGGTNGSTDN